MVSPYKITYEDVGKRNPYAVNYFHTNDDAHDFASRYRRTYGYKPSVFTGIHKQSGERRFWVITPLKNKPVIVRPERPAKKRFGLFGA